jgi:tetratricopeptide (TPR) repeat protein
VTLDPAFALAWARLAEDGGWSCFYHWGVGGADFRATCQEAKRAAEKAMSLRPDLAESKLAQGFWQYYGERDYNAAISWFEKAHQLSANNTAPLRALALVYRRKGDWQRSLEYFQRAIELDPRNAELLIFQGQIFAALRQYPEALKVYGKILDMIPGDSFALACKILVYQSQGDLPAAAALLAPVQPVRSPYLILPHIDELTYERRYADAIAASIDALGRPDLDQGGNFWIPISVETRLA